MGIHRFLPLPSSHSTNRNVQINHLEQISQMENTAAFCFMYSYQNCNGKVMNVIMTATKYVTD